MFQADTAGDFGKIRLYSRLRELHLVNGRSAFFHDTILMRNTPALRIDDDPTSMGVVVVE